MQQTMCYNCPVVTSYPRTLLPIWKRCKTGRLRFGIRFCRWTIRAGWPRDSARNSPEKTFRNGKSAGALAKAYAEQSAYKADVRQKGEEVLKYIATIVGRDCSGRKAVSH
jgi:predicted nucleotide-binding protein (sugar kinase/HSP70/actin superfamily)